MDVTDIISKAALKNNIVEIAYKDSKGFITERVTEPYEIKDDSYYGFCVLKNGIRRFKLSNILSAKILDKKYNPRWPVKIG